METAQLIVDILQFYLLVGCGVALIFLVIGVDRVDPSARGSYLFRVMALPGCIGIWPLVLYRWFTLEMARRGGAE